MIIEDGRGSGFKVYVDSLNRISSAATSQTTQLKAVKDGDAYNINTGNITFSAAGTLVYIKNNEDQDLVISSIAVGIGSATTSDLSEITVQRNPTGGDLISDATAVSVNQNRGFGSSKTLSADVYKGKSAGTSTGGNDILFFYQASSGRLFAEADLILPKGSSLAITLDPKLSSGTVKAYCAVICFLQLL